VYCVVPSTIPPLPPSETYELLLGVCNGYIPDPFQPSRSALNPLLFPSVMFGNWISPPFPLANFDIHV
jgi:hypothetical protein